jgi:hypothetical protein
VGDDALPIGREGLVDDERLRAHLIAELVEVVDEGAGARDFVRLLLLDDVEGCAQELPAARGGGEKDAIVKDAFVVAFYGVVQVRPVDEDGDLLRRIWPFRSSHSAACYQKKGLHKGLRCTSPHGIADMICSGLEKTDLRISR